MCIPDTVTRMRSQVRRKRGVTAAAPACPHGEMLTRAEAAEHMACTRYGRQVNPRTVDRWADQGLIVRHKVGELQWVRFARAELDALAG
jgi:hypothetical protein